MMGLKVNPPPYERGNSVQVVYTESVTFIDCNTVMPCDDTKPQITEGDEVMTRTITPRFANSRLRVDVVVQYGIQDNNQFCMAALFETSIHVTDAIACGLGGVTNYRNNASVVFTKWIDDPGLAELTFRVRLGIAAGTGVGFNGHATRLGGGSCVSSIVITEIKT